MGRVVIHHQIYETIDNHQFEHQSTMVETSTLINHVKVKTIFDYGATNSFISPFALEKFGFVAYENDEFKQVKKTSRVKKSGRT